MCERGGMGLGVAMCALKTRPEAGFHLLVGSFVSTRTAGLAKKAASFDAASKSVGDAYSAAR